MTPELGMQSTALKEETEECQTRIEHKNFGWSENPDVQRLLDVVSSIMAEEYIEIAKRNLDVFSSGAETTLIDSRLRGNDKEGENDNEREDRNESGDICTVFV